jgi:ribonuclease-3
MSRQASNPPLEKLQGDIGYAFSDRNLLTSALTHSSTGKNKNYERLEFLGDRVLGLVVAETLYEKFPGEAEGDMAKRLAALVRGELLAEIAGTIDLGASLNFSAAERNAGGDKNENILADALEAVIGAMYLDGGLTPCRTLIASLWNGHFEGMKTPPLHPKTALQEWAQGQGLPLPEYTISGQTGPDHAPMFKVKLSVKGHDDIMAEGRSRQIAEKEAARLFMEKISR